MTYTEPLLLLLILSGVLGLNWCKRKSLVAAGILFGLVLMSWRPVELFVAKGLEGRYPIRPFHAAVRPEAIVVLSGNVNPPVFERPYEQPDAETAARCDYAAWIYKQGTPLPVLTCGGGGKGSREPFAATMAAHLRRSGVAAELIWVEGRSRNTHESAVILRAHGIQRIALVINARSMPRAEACFRKQGLTVMAAPSRIDQWGETRDELIPTWKAIKGNEETLHELAGLLWYRLRGWI